MKILEKIIEYGLYLFVFLLPWQTRLILQEGNLNGYWEYGTFSIYATEILLWLIFALAIVWWTAGELKIKNEKLKITIKNSKFVYLLVCLSAYLLYALASVLWADSKNLALYSWHWFAEGIGMFLVLRVVKIDIVKLVWSFIFSALIQSSLGLWQFFSQSTFASKWLGMALHDPAIPGTVVVETALRRWLRAYGCLPHPNILAGFLSVAMFLTFWLYQKTNYSFKKLILPAVFSVLSLGLFTTFSRSVILSFLAILILSWFALFIFRQPRQLKINLLKFTFIFLVIAAIFAVIFWEPVETRISGEERLETKSTAERLDYFGEAWQLIKAHPFFGVGLGNYTLAIHNEINPNLQSWGYQPVHNIYILILAELGIVGFLFWLVAIIFIIKESAITHYPLLVTLLTIGLFDHYLWTFYFGVLLFWLVFSLGQKRLDNHFDKV